jgi:signal transduction histidine kinase
MNLHIVLSALAHELRNPLTNIHLSTEMLGSTIQEEEQKGYLDIINRSSVRINLLITDLLNCLQTSDALPEEQSFPQLLEQAMDEAADRILLKKISVIRDYSLQDAAINLDGPQMRIALNNIIINALEAMAPGHGVLRLSTRHAGNKYLVEIRDNGCGISKTNLPYLFQPYYTNKPNGLGLGLATTYNILQSNNVGITVDSEEGKGTCFSLLFSK